MRKTFIAALAIALFVVGTAAGALSIVSAASLAGHRASAESPAISLTRSL